MEIGPLESPQAAAAAAALMSAGEAVIREDHAFDGSPIDRIRDAAGRTGNALVLAQTLREQRAVNGDTFHQDRAASVSEELSLGRWLVVGGADPTISATVGSIDPELRSDAQGNMLLDYARRHIDEASDFADWQRDRGAIRQMDHVADHASAATNLLYGWIAYRGISLPIVASEAPGSLTGIAIAALDRGAGLLGAQSATPSIAIADATQALRELHTAQTASSALATAAYDPDGAITVFDASVLGVRNAIKADLYLTAAAPDFGTSRTALAQALSLATHAAARETLNRD